MKVEMLPGRPLSREIREAWVGLLETHPQGNPFLSPLWLEVWLRHFGGSFSTKWIVFRDDDGSFAGIGNVSGGLDGGKKGLFLTGSRDVWDYRDFLIRPGREEEAFRALSSALLEGSFDFLELDSIAQFSPTAEIFPRVMEPLGWRVSRKTEETVINLFLPATWEGFLGMLSSKDRHELRRKVRRAEKEGPCELTRMADPAQLNEKMGLFLDLHRKSRRDKSEFMTEEMEAYFRDLAEGFLKNGWLDLSFLRLQGKEIAGFLSFDFGGRKYVYNSGYDPEFSWYSPGIVLAAYCLREAIEKGMKGFNFLRGREDYKYHLGGREETNFRLRAEKA